ncbi:MAG: Glycerol-3-phosphate regulon repressor [SAR116 cluster bacterium MED-G04]|jgi:DeoR family glycerol-3-phosphate regulon repressor|nr:MAG: DeoR family transcriptional regulator [Oceanospirillales bacterium TMED59]CAI8449058.1 MAG: Glycerol-3-phosphate regulon repressor [SAR116 cluster bacterium MED-G04]
MSLNGRQEQIIEELRDYGKVDVEALTAKFAVTSQTVRRDLTELCDRGLAIRTHGGARRMVSTSSLGYEERRLNKRVEKEKIGMIGASLIPNNCSLILNIGTTTEQVARALTDHKDLLVISNNINVIQIFRNSQMRDLVIVGGGVRQSDGAIVGDEAVEFIGRYKVDYAVIGASSLDTDGTVLDFDSREVAVARTILKNARTRILVADSSKFERSAPVRICTLGDLDYVILDRQPPLEFQEAAAREGTQILMDTPGNE